MEQDEIGSAADMLSAADAVIVAASNGFDIADGYNQFSCDREFLRVFGDLHRACGITSIIQGLLIRWPDRGLRWKFISRLIAYGYRDYEPSPVMRALDQITTNAPRFVVTCNCNSHFERAGFSADTILETEGSYARLCCTAQCSKATYDALAYVDADEAPLCPRCGAPLDVAVDDIGRIARLEPFRSQAARLRAFLAQHVDERVCILELGVGQANRAIKAPFMSWAEQAQQASYIVVNREGAVLPALPLERKLALRGDLGEVLIDLAGAMRADVPGERP